MDAVSSKHGLDQNEKDELVLTPGGWRPRSKVHLVEPGYYIRKERDRLTKVQTQTGRVVEDFGKTPEGQLGKRRHSDLKPGREVRTAGGVGTSAPAVGYIVYSEWENRTGNPISYFSTRWAVPPAPATDNGQLIYLFNGIESSTGSFILQPVLQWGISPISGGSYWAITNWYVGEAGGLALHGSLVQVNPGDVLQGIMTLTGCSDNRFNYLSSFNGFSTADLQVNDVDELVWAIEALECYRLKEFSNYPDARLTAFHDIELKVRTGTTPSIMDTDATLDWLANDRVTDNGQRCSIVSNNNPGGEVDLYYKGST